MYEHRVIASQAVGRRLAANEPVVHLNGKLDDNREDNLFICGSVTELRQLYSGDVEWPSSSNLTSYR